jgi:hypothetical protein
MFYLRDDNLIDGLVACLQGHLEQLMGVDFVEDQKGVPFSYCVDQWRFLRDLESSNPNASDIQTLPNLLLVEAQYAD